MNEPLPKVLAIDDDRLWLEQVPIILEKDAEVTCADTIDQGLLALGTGFFDVVLLDLNFEGDTRTGLDVFKAIMAADHSMDVIVISGETRPDKLIQIMNAGITQFVPKPSSPKQIREAVRGTLEKRELRLKAINVAAATKASKSGVQLVGSSRAMLSLREEIDHVVKSGARDILLIGETGTGKEVVARAIASTADPVKRLVPIHCGAISDGIAESELFGHVRGAFTGADRDRASAFEVVGGGFVFLDEIAEMPLHQQAKLLRVLQERKVQRVGSVEERPVSFRCISATNVDLPKAIEEKRFREDLYYRVARVVIKIPSLRERIEDVPELVAYFLEMARPGAKITVTDQALALLQAYAWPGNVRQLQAVVEAMASRCREGESIRERDVCHAIPELGSIATPRLIRPFFGRTGATFLSSERKRFQKALFDAHGDREKAAELLQISRATFFRRAKELGLTATVRRGS